MIHVAAVLYLILAIFVAYHSIINRSKKDYSSMLLAVVIFIIAFTFYLYPVELNYAITIPFLFFFPIVLSLSLWIKEGFTAIVEMIPAVALSAMLTIMILSDYIFAFGLTLLTIPLVTMAYFIGKKYTNSPSSRVLFAMLGIPFAMMFIFAHRYLAFVLFDFVTSFGFVAFLSTFKEIKKSFEEYVKAILSFHVGVAYEARRKLMHSVVLFVFLPLPLLYQLFSYGVESINSAMVLFTNLRLELTSNISPITLGAMILIGSIVPIFVILDILRLDFGIVIVPEKLLRKHEVDTFGGHVHITVALLLVAMLFQDKIFLAAAAIAFLSDTASAIIGRAFGKHKIVEGRSVEGTLAGIIVAILSAIPFVSVVSAIIVGIVIGITDILIANRLNDNLVFPLVSAQVLSLFYFLV